MKRKPDRCSAYLIKTAVNNNVFEKIMFSPRQKEIWRLSSNFFANKK